MYEGTITAVRTDKGFGFIHSANFPKTRRPTVRLAHLNPYLMRERRLAHRSQTVKDAAFDACWNIATDPPSTNGGPH